MKILERKNARTKADLMKLYLSQYSEQKIRIYINDIITDYRKKEGNRCKNISTQELLTFIELYGLPDGYILSESLQTELDNRKNNLNI